MNALFVLLCSENMSNGKQEINLYILKYEILKKKYLHYHSKTECKEGDIS